MEELKGKVLLFHLSGPISFGAAKGMTRRLSGTEEYEIMLLDLSDVHMIDTTSCKAIEDIIHDQLATNRDVYLIGFDDDVYDVLDRTDVLRPLDESHVLWSRIEALRAANQKLQAD